MQEPPDYACLTVRDKNPVKRFLQNRRLNDALKALEHLPRDFHGTVLDYGGGDGELCARLHQRFPQAQLFLYEPAPALREQARHRLGETVHICGALAELPISQADYLFCLEVFEHLPPQPETTALQAIHRLLAKEGLGIIGVPVEIHTAALLKGLFRMTRRYGEYDAQPRHILQAALGRPPDTRPVAELAQGLPYYPYHLGFDLRVFHHTLSAQFRIERSYGSPLPWLGHFFNSEYYFLVRPLT